MACTEAELLTALLDGELADPDRARVEAHAASCADCQRDLALLRTLSPKLNQLPVLEPSAQLRRDVLSDLPSRRSLRDLLRWPVLLPVGALAAAAVLLVVRAPEHVGPDIVLAENLELVENLGAAQTADLSDEDLDVVAHLDELEQPE